MLFKALADIPTLIFSGGKPGYNANIVGKFTINETVNEDSLDMGDGTNHVHIDWSKLAGYEIGSFHGEGMITFFDVECDSLFKMYNPDGPFHGEIFKNRAEF